MDTRDHDRIVDIAADLLGTDDIKMYTDQLFMKGPETGSAQPWHQDSASWRDLFPMDLVTAWTAIDAATRENGCLEFAAGTHRWGMMKGEQLAPHIPHLGRDPWPIVAAPLEPGSISFHHSLTLHRSGANSSAARRRGYAVHYMRATTVRTSRSPTPPGCPPIARCGAVRFPAACSVPSSPYSAFFRHRIAPVDYRQLVPFRTGPGKMNDVDKFFSISTVFLWSRTS